VGSLPANAGANFVLIDPEQPLRVYAADTSTLYRSDDAGQTWEQATNGLPEGSLTALSLDPGRPQRLYAVVGEALYQSEDGAMTWSALPGAESDVDG
jgi:photosystem II stability/assembly factor-like uncharacterized protein